MIKWFHPTCYNGCNYLSTLGLKLNHVSYKCHGGYIVSRHFVGVAIQWRHNERDGVSNHQPHDGLVNRLFRRRSNKASKLRATAFVRWIHWWPVNLPHKWPVTRKMFPFDDVIMWLSELGYSIDNDNIYYHVISGEQSDVVAHIHRMYFVYKNRSSTHLWIALSCWWTLFPRSIYLWTCNWFGALQRQTCSFVYVTHSATISVTS